MSKYYSPLNNVSTLLSLGYTIGQTGIKVANASLFGTPTDTNPTLATVINGNESLGTATYMIREVVGVSPGNFLKLGNFLGGTTDQNISAGATVERRLVAYDISSLQNDLSFVNASGLFRSSVAGVGLSFTNNLLSINTTVSSASLNISAPSNSGLAFLIKASASQTSDLCQWVDISNSTCTSISRFGVISTNIFSGFSNQESINVKTTTNSASGIRGITAKLINSSTTSSTNFSKVYESNITSSGNGGLNNGYHFYANSPSLIFGTGVIQNVYGMYVDSQKVTGVTNGYGIYQNGASDINYFNGVVGIGTNAPNAILEINNDSLFSNSILRLTGAAGQNGNAIELYNSASSLLFYVDAVGTLRNGKIVLNYGDSFLTGLFFRDSANTVDLGLFRIGKVSGLDTITIGTGSIRKMQVTTGASTIIITDNVIALNDSQNISFGTTTGLKFGTGTNQKLGFWNTTPIVQPTVSGSKASGAALSSLMSALSNLGLINDTTTA